MVEITEGYNVLMLHDDSIDTAHVIRDLSFPISPYQKNAHSEYGPIYARPTAEKTEDGVERELLHNKDKVLKN